MLDPRLEPETPRTENGESRHADEQLTAFLMKTVEQIQSALSASGVVVAIRDAEGACCVASTGEAPAVGSRLQPDSAFTRACFESAEVVLCEDSEHDSRIHPAVAKSLGLRSAVAVPIPAQGTIIGVIEVFSPRPRDIRPADIDGLKAFADLFAGVLGPRSASIAPMPVAEASPNGSGSPSSQTQPPSEAPLLSPKADPPARVAPPPDTEEEDDPSSYSVSKNWFPREPRRFPREERADSSRSFLQSSSSGSASSPSTSARSDEKSTSTQISRGRAASVSFLVILFFFLFFFLFGTSRSMIISTSASSRAPEPPSPSDSGPHRTSLSTPGKVSGAERARAPSASRSDLPSSGIAIFPRSPQQNPDPAAAHLTSTPSEGDGVLNVDNSLGFTKSLAAPPHQQMLQDVPSENISSSAMISGAAKLDSFQFPIEPVNGVVLAAMSASPISNRSMTTSRPNFVLDHRLKGHSSWVTGVAFTSDGRRLASASWDQTVKFWDVYTGNELGTVGSKTKQVQALALSRDGHWLAAENSSDNVTVWDATTGREVRTLATDKSLGALGSNWVYSIAFSPDGRWLASGVDDKTVRIWDVTTGRAVRDLTASRRSVIYAAFSPDGRWLASGNDDRSIRIWDVSTGQEICTLNGHKKSIYAVAFSPNGRWLASASADKTVKIWDIAVGREVRTLTGHHSLVTSLAFSPDGRWLASGSWDKAIKIWNVETGQEIQTLIENGNHPVYSVAFDARGRWLASGSEDGAISFWRAGNPQDHSSLQ